MTTTLTKMRVQELPAAGGEPAPAADNNDASGSGSGGDGS